MKHFKLIAVTLFFLVTYVTLVGQNAASIDVNNLSEQQIQQIVSEVSSRGLTIDQAAQMAQMRGATPVQIDQLKRRIQELNLTKGKSVANPAAAGKQENTVVREAFSEKVKVEASPKAKRIFGFQLFNNENLTFEPPVNIPTPQNYVLGIGDEIQVSIWGASQQTYQLQIATNGAVSIPDIGPVYVSGMEFSKAKEVIRKRLFSIYQNMAGNSPNTWAEISISSLRSVKINVIGEALAPGTYTLPATASAFNALYLSGGPGENGSFRNIQVIRDNKIIKTIDVYDYIINANTAGNIQLREQDIIYIPTYSKRVDASGSFKRNGIFELTEKETLADLIRYLGGFSDNAYREHLSLTRITETERRVADINSADFDRFELKNGDNVVASDITDRYENRVTITGAVFRPGTYELSKDLTLRQLIEKAQGVRENYYANRGLILRLNENLEPVTLSFDVNNILNGKENILLKREDNITIQDIFSMKEKQNITIEGEVNKPGTFDYSDNMTLKDLIFQSGGLTEAASESFIELARRHSYQEAGEITEKLVELKTVTISRDLKLTPSDDSLILKPFDHIYVRRAPSYFEQRTVYISGEVKLPGSYSIQSKTERISDLLSRAGGLLSSAYINGAKLQRSNILGSQNFGLIRSLQFDSLTDKAAAQINTELVELRLDEILKNPGSVYDYQLKNGDRIIIPEIAQEVRIAGEVFNPIGLAYQHGKSFKYYANMAGGFSDKASKKRAYVIYSNGTTDVTRTFIFRKYPKVEPGSQIIVPKKPEKNKFDNTGKWLGIASTLATVSVSIMAVLNYMK